jgi:hypothetical protein
MSIEPPIFAVIARLRADIERAVTGNFPRKHRYASGQDLRDRITAVATAANRAWRDRENAGHWTSRLVWEVDELKLAMRLAKDLNAFASFRQFEHLIRQAEDLGRQCGGWNRQNSTRNHPLKGQSPARVPAQPGRAKTLSTSAASPRGHA